MLLGLLVAILIVLALYVGMKNLSPAVETKIESDRKNEENRLKAIENERQRKLAIIGTDGIEVTYNNDEFVVIHEQEKTVFVCNELLKFEDILNYELKDDKVTTSTAKLNPDAARAMAFGIASGNLTFANIAARTSIATKTVIETTKHDYKLILTINRIENPLLTIQLNDTESAEKLSCLFSVIINKNKEVKTVSALPAASKSLSEKLYELNALKKDGLLTDEEYKNLKDRILSSL